MPFSRRARSHLAPCRRPRVSRRVAAVVAGSVALTGVAAGAPGVAKGLDDRKDQVEQQIDQTEENLQHSSEELVASVRRLEEAQAALTSARSTLAQTRGELAVAQSLDQRMQVELATAVEELSRARAELAEGQQGMRRSKRDLRTLAAQQQASGGADLLALSTVLNSQNPAKLTGQLTSRGSVLDKQAATLAEFEAADVVLTVQEEAVETAKRQVAQRRAAAAENLALQGQLAQQAEQVESQVAQLVTDRSAARRAAAAAKAEDLGQLQQFEAEREQISVLLQRRAERARLRAEAAARAAAAARARAEAAERARAEAAARARAAHERSTPEPAPPAPTAQPVAPAPPRPTAGGTLLYPVNGYVTSPYGMRLHPVYKRWSLHDGTDFGAACGTPVRAAAGGTVVGLYYDSAYGKRVILDHGWVSGGGLGTTYNHLSGFSTYVGDRVRRGEVIGYVGSTGYSTGCHLHFMVFRDGATVDPMNWL